MTAPTAAATGTPSVAAVSTEFPPLVLASAPRAARRAIVPPCALLPGVFKQAVHTLAH
jgi:hypothetical protein